MAFGIWFAWAMLLAVGYLLSLPDGIGETWRNLSSSLIVLFLFISMFFIKSYNRLLLWLAMMIWIVIQADFSYMTESGIAIFLGAVAFSAGLFYQDPVLGRFGFDLEDLVGSIEIPYVILDLSGKVVFANSGFLKASGYNLDTLTKVEAIDIFDIPSDWRFKLYSSEKYKKIRCRLITFDGKRTPVLLWLNEVRRSGKDLINLLCIIQDESEKEAFEKKSKEESGKFTSLYETSLAISSSLEMKDVLESISRAAENLTHSDTCSIFLMDHSRQVLKTIYSTEDSYNTEVMNFEIPVGQGLTGAVVSDGKPRIQNYDDEVKLSVHIPGTTEEEESLLSMPLLAKDAVIGALTLYKIDRRRFEEDDMKLLTVFASQASSIIENSRLFMKLKESERLYRSSVDLAGDGILFVDSETGRITDINGQAQRMLKYTKAESVLLNIWELHPLSQMQMARELWKKTIGAGQRNIEEIELLAKDGSLIPASIRASHISIGETRFIQWSIRDISEYKRKLEKYSFYQQVFDQHREPILLCDPRGRILNVNEKFCSFFGLQKEQVEKSDLISLCINDARMAPLKSCWLKLKGRDSLFEQIGGDHSAGIPGDKYISIQSHYGENGNIKYYLWLIHLPVVSRKSTVASMTGV